jgi:cell surface protein SprA
MKTIMVGIRNPLKSDPNNPWKPDNGDPECAIVWINEMRLTDFVSEGGSAAIGQMQLQVADFANVNASGNYSGINWGSVESRVQERQRNERIGIDLNSTVQLGQFFGKQTRISLPFFYGYSLGIVNPEYDPFNPDVKLADYDIATRKEKAKAGQEFNERRSFNFTNVRKEAKAGAKPHFWNISNWSATYAFSENLKRDFNINYDRTKTWTGALNYNFTFPGKAIEPFKKWKPVQKSKWLQLVKDFNLFLLPKNISFTNDYSRLYNERQVRNNIVPDYKFAPVFMKRFDWIRNYQLGYDLTKNIKATFSATNKSIFEEGNHGVDRVSNPDGYREFLDTIRSQMQSFGRTMDYTHNYNLGITLPLDKFPLTNWLTVNAKYGGTFNWQRAPLGQSQFGNTIQNNRSINLTAQANMMNIYNKIPFLKKTLGDGKINRSQNKLAKSDGGENAAKKPETEKPEEEFKPSKPIEEMTAKELRQYEREKKRWERKKEREKRKKQREKEKMNPALGFASRLLMTVRNISGTYTLNDGTLLPGYSQESSILGMNGSSLGLTNFVFGKQGYDLLGRTNGYNVSVLARDNNWLVQNENMNKQFTTTHAANLQMKATLEPFKDFNINLNLNRNYSKNSGEFYRWNPTSSAFESQSKFETSTLTYSTVTLGTAFAKEGRAYQSDVFQKLLDSRSAVSQLIGASNANSSLLPSQFYEGYSGSQQEVVIGAFLTAYTNSSVNSRNINPLNNIPLPNWTVNYNGLTKYEFTKKFLKSFTLKHSYSSTVTVGGMQTNLNATVDANGNATARDLNNNYIAPMQVQNVAISERFSPLIGVNATWTLFGKTLMTNFEYKKDRNATLSLANNQISENLGKEIVVGTTFTYPKLKLPIRSIKASDLIVNLNVGFKDNLTVIRNVVENTNQATAGQKTVNIKIDANYKLTEYLTASFNYEQGIINPKVQTSVPTGNLKINLAIRFDLNGLK